MISFKKHDSPWVRGYLYAREGQRISLQNPSIHSLMIQHLKCSTHQWYNTQQHHSSSCATYLRCNTLPTLWWCNILVLQHASLVNSVVERSPYKGFNPRLAHHPCHISEYYYIRLTRGYCEMLD